MKTFSLIIVTGLLYFSVPAAAQTGQVKSTEKVVDLGDGFTLHCDSNSAIIYFQPSYNNPSAQKDTIVPKVMWTVESRVQQIGFSDKDILVIASTKNGVRYLHVDKSIAAMQKGSKEEEAIRLNNVNAVTQKKFKEIETLRGIKLAPIHFYK